MSETNWATELTFTERGETYPFVEDEDANITGYGHQDRAAFAEAVNHYDELCGNCVFEFEQVLAEHISHDWAITDPYDGERVIRVTEDVPGAFPITTLWGYR